MATIYPNRRAIESLCMAKASFEKRGCFAIVLPVFSLRKTDTAKAVYYEWESLVLLMEEYVRTYVRNHSGR
jgi:hypothetical protein